jgi:hypothetical protein
MSLSTSALKMEVAKFPKATGGALESQVCQTGGHSFLSNSIIICMGADILVSQLVELHMEVSCFLVLESNAQQGLLQLLPDRSQGKAKSSLLDPPARKKILSMLRVRL